MTAIEAQVLDRVGQITQAAHTAQVMLKMPSMSLDELAYHTTIRGVEYHVSYERTNGLGAIECKDDRGRWSTVASFDEQGELSYL